MNIVEKIKQNQSNKLTKKVKPIVENYLKEKTGYELSNYQKDKRFCYQLAENKVWYAGKKELLMNFYKNPYYNGVMPDNITAMWNKTEFWRVVTGNKVTSHFPLASMISETKASLIFNQMPETDVNTGNKTTSEFLTSLLNDIFDDNDMEHQYQTGAQLESYSGTIAAKISLDDDLSDYPIVEFYPAEDIELVSKYRRVIEIIFNDTYTHNGNEYNLKSHYGYGYIHYELLNKKKTAVKLETVPDLANLKDIYFTDKSGNLIPVMLACYKVNRAINNEFVFSCYGESDYSGIIDIFHSLDESWSMKDWTTRANTPKVYLTEDMCAMDSFGRRIVPNEYDTDYIMLNDNKIDGEKGVVRRDTPSYDIDKFIEDNKHTLNAALSKAGFSAQTIFESAAGANASAEALMVREGRSMRTRQQCIRLWVPFINNLARLLLIFNSVKDLDKKADDDGIRITIENTFDYDYTTEFPPYEEETPADRLPFIKEAMEAGLMDRETAIRKLYPDYTDEQVIEMLNKIEGVIELEREEEAEAKKEEEEEETA